MIPCVYGLGYEACGARHGSLDDCINTVDLVRCGWNQRLLRCMRGAYHHTAVTYIDRLAKRSQ